MDWDYYCAWKIDDVSVLNPGREKCHPPSMRPNSYLFFLMFLFFPLILGSWLLPMAWQHRLLQTMQAIPKKSSPYLQTQSLYYDVVLLTRCIFSWRRWPQFLKPSFSKWPKCICFPDPGCEMDAIGVDCLPIGTQPISHTTLSGCSFKEAIFESPPPAPDTLFS